MSLVYHFFCGIGFSDQISGQKIDHIHGHFTAGGNMALAASKFLGIPFSLTAHASGDIFVRPMLLEEKMRDASFVVTVCEYTRKYLDSITGYRYSHKLRRIYNGIDASEPEALLGTGVSGARRADRVPNTFTIVSVGRLVGCKGFATLIDACKLLRERGHPVASMIIGDGPERKNLSALIDKWELRDTVLITGYLPSRSVYETLWKADIFALLSEVHLSGYRDGFPTVILEAMLMSLPVVSTWVSGIPEMVIHGKTGFLVHERDASGVANALEALIMDDTMRSDFGTAGRQRAIELFTLEKNIGILTDLFMSSMRATGNSKYDP
jgi:glycosyltransferase involved in cell wall biosynthesis